MRKGILPQTQSQSNHLRETQKVKRLIHPTVVVICPSSEVISPSDVGKDCQGDIGQVGVVGPILKLRNHVRRSTHA